MNQLQLESQLVEWLKQAETETQSKFLSLQTDRFAWEGIGMYEGAIKEKIENDMEVVLFRFHWLRKQMDNITQTF